ncbi:MAG: hypothetical protein RBT40_09300 [Petrimonas sp.]|jgi:proteic killer suppression protein|nr:hypothetical protein [Petrimonas sp.]
MDITFKSTKLRKIFESKRDLIRNYGEVRGKKLSRLISFLRAAPCLENVPPEKPFRRHELISNRKGQFSVEITGNYRLILEPCNEPLPVKEDGGLDLKKITRIKIIEVEDYHGD